jgi:hypothetical protein
MCLDFGVGLTHADDQRWIVRPKYPADQQRATQARRIERPSSEQTRGVSVPSSFVAAQADGRRWSAGGGRRKESQTHCSCDAINARNPQACFEGGQQPCKRDQLNYVTRPDGRDECSTASDTGHPWCGIARHGLHVLDITRRGWTTCTIYPCGTRIFATLSGAPSTRL